MEKLRFFFLIGSRSYKAKNKKSEVFSGRVHSLTVWCLQRKRSSSKQKGKAEGTGWPYWPYLGCKLREVSPMRLGLERVFHLSWGAVGLEMLLSGGVSQAFAKPGFDHRRQGILGGVVTYAYSASYQEAGCRGITCVQHSGQPKSQIHGWTSRVLELSLPIHNPSPGSQVKKRF